MERAYDMGFELTPWYHGTLVWSEPNEKGYRNGDIKSFNHRASVENIRRPESLDTLGVWLSDNPTDKGAGMYAPRERGAIYQVLIRSYKPYYDTWDGLRDFAIKLAGKQERMNQPVSMEPFRKWLMDNGYDAVRLDDDNAEFINQRVIVILDPSNIRSVNAAFDKSKDGSTNILD